MEELKTQVNDASVTKFLDSVTDETKRADSYKILEMMQRATNEQPKMWGSSIIGFGTYHYVYDSGREGDMPLAAFSPRKQYLTIYGSSDGWEKYPELPQLGKYTLGKSCLYINTLADVKLPILRKLINQSLKDAKKQALADAKKKTEKSAKASKSAKSTQAAKKATKTKKGT